MIFVFDFPNHIMAIPANIFRRIRLNKFIAVDGIRRTS